jgi:protein-S-isoprenylcysteine O-methyltransferase Ste14
MGFLALLSADFLFLRGKKAAAALQWAGYLGVGAATGLLGFAPTPWWPLPDAGAASVAPLYGATPLGAAALSVAAALAGGLLAWSVFFEFGAERRRHGLGPLETVRTGTYRHCRHPGFWWYAILVAALAALRAVPSAFATAALLAALDFILVLEQDLLTFPKVLAGYDDYKRVVPFLLPRSRRAKPSER